MKTKNELYFVFHFFYETGKRINVLEIQTENLLNMKMTANYLNFVFRIEVFQYIKNTKWHLV